MRLHLILSAVLFAASALPAQEKPAQEKEKPAELKQENFEAVIIPIKSLMGDSFLRLAAMLEVFNVRFKADDKLRTIVVYAPKEVGAQMRRVVEELDRPGSEVAIGHNIDLTLSFLRCSTKAQSEARPLPADLEAVARQLRAATQYKDVQLWDIVPLHIQEGKETEQSLRLPNAPGVQNVYTVGHIKVRPEAVSRKDSGRYVRFERMNVNFRVPVASGENQRGQLYQYLEVGLNTSGDFMEGQKSVLGKISGMDDVSAIFVVISLKVLD